MAKDNNYDIAANDALLGGECALLMLGSDEAKKACKGRLSNEIDTEDMKSKYLLSVFWKDKLESMH